MLSVGCDDRLFTSFVESFVICQHGCEISAVIEKKHIAEFIFMHVANGELILKVDDFTFSDVIRCLKLSGNFKLCKSNAPLLVAIEEFKKTSYIVVCSESKIEGVIAKAHRRY